MGGSTSAETTPRRATSTAPRRSVGAGSGGAATPVAPAAGGKKKVAANAVGKEDLETISVRGRALPLAATLR